jgi:hypothetical protein
MLPLSASVVVAPGYYRTWYLYSAASIIGRIAATLQGDLDGIEKQKAGKPQEMRLRV